MHQFAIPFGEQTGLAAHGRDKEGRIGKIGCARRVEHEGMAVEFEATHGALWPARSLRGGLGSGINGPRVLPSSSGLGHRPLTAKIAGSNPVGSTSHSSSKVLNLASLLRVPR